MRGTIAIAASVLVLVIGSVGVSGAPLALNRDLQLVENVRPRAQISGDPVVGLQMLGAPAAAATPLSALIPAAWRGDQVCARLASSDGLYDALGQYDVPADWAGGIAELAFPTGHGGRVLEIAPASMAVLVSRGACTADGGALALGAWRANPGGEAVAMVNSYRADETYLVFPLTGGDVDCQPNPDPQRTAFDMICPIPGELVAAGGTIEVEVNRVRGGAFVPPDLVAIDLP